MQDCHSSVSQNEVSERDQVARNRQQEKNVKLEKGKNTYRQERKFIHSFVRKMLSIWYELVLDDCCIEIQRIAQLSWIVFYCLYHFDLLDVCMWKDCSAILDNVSFLVRLQNRKKKTYRQKRKFIHGFVTKMWSIWYELVLDDCCIEIQRIAQLSWSKLKGTATAILFSVFLGASAVLCLIS